MRTRIRTIVVALAITGTAGSTGCSDDPEAPPLRLHQIQVLAAHNAYHLEAEPALLEAVAANLPEFPPTIEYSHPTLTEQLELGLRSFELDVFEDPEGGRYASPVAVGSLGLEPVDAAMTEPGFKVFHIQEIDYRSTCPTFVACIGELTEWSDAHPDHLPIIVHLEVKDGPIPDPFGFGFVQPIPASAATFSALEAEIGTLLTDEQIVTVADVQGEHDTLRAAIEGDGWPAVDDLRGRFLFVLDDAGAKRDLYRSLHPDTRDRRIFVSAQPPADDAAFMVINDPVADGDRIRALVARGYLVRTRADADTMEARAGATARRDAAFNSGAQIVSTDYERADPRFDGYIVTLPASGPGRCNPVSSPEDCDDEVLAEGDR